MAITDKKEKNFDDTVKNFITENNFIKDKTVLVTGGGGSIGRVLCKKILEYKPEKLIIADICENNVYMLLQELEENTYAQIVPEILSVCNKDMLKRLFVKHKPNIIYHAAAHKHVSLMEENPCEAVINNVFGTKYLLESAIKYKAEKVVIISTDKAVKPVGVMGATKKVCEMLADLFSLQIRTSSAHKTAISSVRFGNITASDGSVIPIFAKQIENGGPVTITDFDCTRYFMTATEAVNLLLAAGVQTKGGEIFALDMGKPHRIYDIAEKMITEHGLIPDKDIKIISTGLRPGERLHEENTLDLKTASSTSVKGVYKAQSLDFDHQFFIRKLDGLYKYCKKNNDHKVRKILFDIINSEKTDNNTINNTNININSKNTDIKNYSKIKRYNIPIFIPHEGCPHTCTFCNQTKITGVSTHVTCDDVDKIIRDYLSYLPQNNLENSKTAKKAVIEVAFFGGSFTGLPLPEQEAFLKTANKYSDRISGIRMSTRPDYINDEVLSLAKKYNVKTIELGIQSADDKVLELNNRGHSFADVIKAAELIKKYDINFGAQVMVGMYGSDPETDIETAKKVVSLAPECVRIYPTLTLKGTKLEELYYAKKYIPYDMETALDTTDKIMHIFEEADCEIIRVGLHSDENLTTDNITAGPYHPAFKELVLSRRSRNLIEAKVIKYGIKNRTYTITVPQNRISCTVGHNKSNIKYFKEKYNIDLKIKSQTQNS